MTPADLAAWRARLGLSQAGAAELLGCARNSLASWERGKTPIPRYVGLACKQIEGEWHTRQWQKDHAKLENERWIKDQKRGEPSLWVKRFVQEERK